MGSMILAVLLVSGVVLVGVEESAQAAFPGKNGKIAFVRNNDIFTIDPATHRVKRLTDTLKKEYDPAWSSDGRWLAFGRDGDIYKMRGDGSDQVRLTQTQTLEAGPAWSPSGTRIVFSRSVPQKHGDLFTIRSGGSELQRLTNTPEVFEGSPAWSPDGSKIAYATLATGALESAIHVINAAGSSDYVLVSDLFSFIGDPDWSPDGETIAFDSFVIEQVSSPRVVYSINADSRDSSPREANRLTGRGLDPVFAPNGNKIAFIKKTQDYPGHPGGLGLWTMRADGSNDKPLIRTGVATPSWQPLP